MLSELLKLNYHDTRETVSIGKGRPGVKTRMADLFVKKIKKFSKACHLFFHVSCCIGRGANIGYDLLRYCS